jgi:hypothetical protein
VNRRALALILPLATTGITVTIIIIIGKVLLATREWSHNMGLTGCALAGRGGTPTHDPHHH